MPTRSPNPLHWRITLRGLEVVVHEIIEQGRQQAAAIEKEGLTEAKAILAEAKEKAEKSLAERETAATRDAERLRVQEIARAEFEAKKKVLTAQRGLLARLKDEANAALAGLPDDKRRAYLEKLVARAKREIPSGTIHCRAEDESIVSGLADYAVKADLTGIGGVIVDDDSGSISLDLRFESLLEEAWPAVLRSETKELFA